MIGKEWKQPQLGVRTISDCSNKEERLGRGEKKREDGKQRKQGGGEMREREQKKKK